MMRATGGLVIAAALLGAAGVILAVTPAEAASRICRQLRAELSASSGGGRNSGSVAKYDDAIDRQRGEIDKARSQARHAGCGFSLFGANVTQCATLNAAIDSMGRNLDSLQRKRAKLAGGGSRRSPAKLQAMLDTNGCNGNGPKAEASSGATAGHSPNLLQMLFGGSVQRADPPDSVGRSIDDGQDIASPVDDDQSGQRIEKVLTPRNGRIVIQNGLPSGTGDYRTLCVRTCDGYFFPMSNAATVGDFERDQKNCESSCPGTDIQVFYTQGMDADPATMISVATGRPYNELPAAFLYKQPNMSAPKSCGCNAARNFTAGQNFKVIAGDTASPDQPAATGDNVPTNPMPGIKPDPAADPETTANAEGGLDLETIRTLAKKPPSPVSDDLPPEQRKVRVVGPTFLPDPKGAIDLRVPDPKAIQ